MYFCAQAAGSCIWCDTNYPRSLVVISHGSLIWQTSDFSITDGPSYYDDDHHHNHLHHNHRRPSSSSSCCRWFSMVATVFPTAPPIKLSPSANSHPGQKPSSFFLNYFHILFYDDYHKTLCKLQDWNHRVFQNNFHGYSWWFWSPIIRPLAFLLYFWWTICTYEVRPMVAALAILWTKAGIKAQMLHQTRIVFSGRPSQTMVNRLHLMSIQHRPRPPCPSDLSCTSFAWSRGCGWPPGPPPRPPPPGLGHHAYHTYWFSSF